MDYHRRTGVAGRDNTHAGGTGQQSQGRSDYSRCGTAQNSDATRVLYRTGNFQLPVSDALDRGVLFLTLRYVYHELPDKTACLFLAAGVVSVGAMVLSPTYPPRATFGSMIFFIVAILRMIDQILDKNEKFLRINYLAACFGYLAFTMHMLTAVGYMVLKSVSVIPDFL